MKRLLGAAAALGGLFMGGSTGPMELDYISYSGAAISGYANTEYFGAHHPVLSDDSEQLAEFIEPDPEQALAGAAEGGSAEASDSPGQTELPLQAGLGNAYDPGSPFISTSGVTESFPIGGPLLGDAAGQRRADKAKSAANETLAGKSPVAAISGKARARHVHRRPPTREAGCVRCSVPQLALPPKALLAWLPRSLFHKQPRAPRERPPISTPRKQELAALSL